MSRTATFTAHFSCLMVKTMPFVVHKSFFFFSLYILPSGSNLTSLSFPLFVTFLLLHCDNFFTQETTNITNEAESLTV